MLAVIKVMLLKNFLKCKFLNHFKRKTMLSYLSYVKSYITADLIWCNEIELNKVM